MQDVVGTIACNTGPNGHDAGNFCCNQAVAAGHVLPVAIGPDCYNGSITGDIAATMQGNGSANVADPVECARALDTNGGYATNQGGNVVLQALPLNTMTIQGRPSDDGRMGSGIGAPSDPCPTLTKAHSHAVAYAEAPQEFVASYTPSGLASYSEGVGTLRASGGDLGGDSENLVVEKAVPFPETADCLYAAYGTKWNGNAAAFNGSLFAATGVTFRVRRLLPVECERLQGFPDNWTRIAWRGATPENCPDGPRYKAIGNSMAVPVMAWIGRRIDGHVKR